MENNKPPPRGIRTDNRRNANVDEVRDANAPEGGGA